MQPTLGRIVLFRSPMSGQDQAAIVTAVGKQGTPGLWTVSLTAFPPGGAPADYTDVRQAKPLVGQPIESGTWRWPEVVG